MRIHGDVISGNCLKVKWTADHLGIAYDWVAVDIMKGEARTRAFRRLNPAAQAPVLELDDGRAIAQSNAIIRYLGRGSELIPPDPYDAAKMDEWLFWEQYSHEPYIAVARFQVRYLGKAVEALSERLVEGGNAALALMEARLADRRFLVAERLTLADIALVAYTSMADEGGFDLARYPAVGRWVGATRSALGL